MPSSSVRRRNDFAAEPSRCAARTDKTGSCLNVLRGILNDFPAALLMIVAAGLDALAAIVRDSEAFPAAGGVAVRQAVGAYVRVVVDDEWPQMQDTGGESPLAERKLDDISTELRTVRPTSPARRRSTTTP